MLFGSSSLQGEAAERLALLYFKRICSGLAAAMLLLDFGGSAELLDHRAFALLHFLKVNLSRCEVMRWRVHSHRNLFTLLLVLKHQLLLFLRQS